MEIKISTVTPVYNGAKYLEELIEKLYDFKQKYEPFNLNLIESIFVLDGCIDNSLEVLKKLEKKYHFINVIELSKNYGQHQATIAGILHSSGDWVATLDEDLQHHPKYIINMLKKNLYNNNDICYANSETSTHKSFMRDRLSILFKKLMQFATDNKNIPYFNSFRLIRGEIARATAAVNAPNTYFDISLSWFTNRVTNIKLPLVDIRNISGESKSGYSFRGLIKHAKRMITSTQMKFLRLSLLMVLFTTLFAVVFSVTAAYQKINGLTPQNTDGWASIIISVFFFGSVCILLLGVLIETSSDLLIKSKGLPTFFVVDRSKDKPLSKILSNIE